MTTDKNGKNLSQLKIIEVLLVYSRVFNNDYKLISRVQFTLICAYYMTWWTTWDYVNKFYVVNIFDLESADCFWINKSTFKIEDSGFELSFWSTVMKNLSDE